MPQRMVQQYSRLDTTVSSESLEQMERIARKIERSSGRRYRVSRTEVLELAIDWMAKQPWERKRQYSQVDREGRVPFHLGLKIPARTLEKLSELGDQLTRTDDYERPHRTREDRPNLGDTIEWCVEHFADVVLGLKEVSA